MPGIPSAIGKQFLAMAVEDGSMACAWPMISIHRELEDHNGAAKAGGFSLHAGIDIATGQRAKLERLCRYVRRPPVATERWAGTERIRAGALHPTATALIAHPVASRTGRSRSAPAEATAGCSGTAKAELSSLTDTLAR